MSLITRLLTRLCVFLGGATLVAMTSMVVVDIFMRTLLSRSLGFVEEITGYLVVAVTFLGVSMTFREGAMFRVSFLYEMFPPALKKALGVVYLAASLLFCAAMSWYTALMVWSSHARGKVAATELQTPIYIPQLFLPIGFLILSIFILDKLFRRESSGASPGETGSAHRPAGE
jgi:TRAP-type C4-dicarboxylate transport system permease small subunit